MPTFPKGHSSYVSRVKNAKVISAIVRETGGNLAAEREAQRDRTRFEFATYAAEREAQRDRTRFEFATYADVRGIPAIGPNCPGRIAGTRPDAICDR